MKANRQREFEEPFLKYHGITPGMDKEIVLKKICKHSLMGSWEIGKVIGAGLNRRKHKEQSKELERIFKRQLLPTLTRNLKKAGVLPL